MQKNYHKFLFLSIMTRNLVEVFSIIILYNKGYSINNIFLFLLIMYFIGIFTNIISIIFNYKIILIISSILYGISYLYLSFMNNTFLSLIILSIILALSSYSYHTIRHLLAMNLVKYNHGKNINIILITTYIGIIISNILGMILINKLPIWVTGLIVLLLSFISIIPVWKLNNIKTNKISLRNVKISKDKIIFSILEQFKVIFLELQPLYIYLYINNSTYYVGIFNIIINIASLIFMIFIISKINNKYFKYLNIIFGIVLVLKLNINSSIILLLIAFLEGVFTKLYEKNSLDNLYDLGNNNINSYLLLEEIIFFTSKFIIMFILLFINNLHIILYICIIGIVISGFYKRIE